MRLFRASILPVALAFLSVAQLSAAGKRVERPNVIFIVVDTLRVDHLGVYGFPGNISPNIDKFAAECVRFDRCAAGAPWTKPSVATLFTSTSADVHQVINPKWPPSEGNAAETEVLSSSFTTMAEAFHAAGYKTAAFVSNHWLQDPFGYSQGFDTYTFLSRYRQNQEVARWVVENATNTPFFLYAHFMEVHGPYVYDEADYQEMYAITSSSFTGTLTEEQVQKLPPYSLDTFKSNPERINSIAAWRAAYAAGVKRFDGRIEMVMEAIRRSGVMDNTIIVLTSDHGEGLMDHDWMDHGNTVNIEELQVPLLIRFPKAARAGERRKEWMGLIDLFPTLAELCGVTETGGPLGGRSLAKRLSYKLDRRERPMYATAQKGAPWTQSLILESYHYILNPAVRGHQLYDLKADPAEKSNLASKLPDVSGRLRQILLKDFRPPPRKDPPERETMSEEMRENLRSLGYLQ